MPQSLPYLIMAAFLGGVILNVMPCVLPVLSMKIFHVVEKAKEDPSINRKHGLAYLAGIMVSFWVFAAIIIGLRAGGDRMGWGMQFQNPALVAVLTAMMVIFGLNALGVFEFTVSTSVDGDDSAFGSFVNGIVASMMATPCSAPFLGAAATYALGSGAVWWQTLLMFSFIGFGLGFPFLLISFIPAFSKILPQPGEWMVTFKQLMGFTLLGAAIWLLGTLQSQITKGGLQFFLVFLLILSMALWAKEKFGGFEHSTKRRIGVAVAAVASIVGAWVLLVDLSPLKKETTQNVASAAWWEDPVVDGGHINWRGFNTQMVDVALKHNRPVFMDFTADWCANCKTNEKTVLETDTIRNALTEAKLLPMKADFTNEDAEIQKWIDKLGRAGIPIYVVFYPDGTHDLLPEIITKDMVLGLLKKASTKYPHAKFKKPPATDPVAPAAAPSAKTAAR